MTPIACERTVQTGEFSTINNLRVLVRCYDRDPQGSGFRCFHQLLLLAEVVEKVGAAEFSATIVPVGCT
jgi:hypothetical protein